MVRDFRINCEVGTASFDFLDATDGVGSRLGSTIKDTESMASILEVLEQQVTVCFSVKKSCDYGERVALLGNATSLGEWDPGRAIEMEWTEGDLWILPPCKSPKLTTGQALQYKYVIMTMDEEGKSSLTWQEGENNRIVLGSESDQATGRAIARDGTSTIALVDDWDRIHRDGIDKNYNRGLPKTVPIECFVCGKCLLPQIHAEHCVLGTEIRGRMSR